MFDEKPGYKNSRETVPLTLVVYVVMLKREIYEHVCELDILCINSVQIFVKILRLFFSKKKRC